MTKQEIGQILRAAREAKGMTQKQAAEMLGRRQQIVGHWETGYAQPDANTLFELCDIYGISIDEAFGKTKPVQSDTLYISRPTGVQSTDELRRNLHQFIDELDEESLRNFTGLFIKMKG